MIDHEQRWTLIAYRLEQAKESIEEARIMLENEKFRAAINRIYYGIFYALLALGLKYQFETSKHGQLLGWFNKTFIKDAILPRKYGKIAREAFDVRQKGDYDAHIEFSKDDVIQKYEQMKDFVGAIEQFIFSGNDG
jgi:uncharacterized protein (UPF0332 family)